MNSYERIFKRLHGDKVDKIPNLNIIMTFAAKYIDVSYKKYVSDYHYLVKGNLAVCEEFGIDMVSVISDPCREAHDLGADIEFPEDDVPRFKSNLINNISDINKLSLKNPANGERMLDRLKAVDLFKEEVKGSYPILGWVEGALAEAADLRGVENIMLDFYEEPDFVNELLEFCNKQAIKFAGEQIKAGADYIGIGDAVASLVGPRNYQSFALPYEKELIEAIHALGAKAKLHICGDISSILELIGETGADIVDIDWMVDFKKSVEIFAGICSANGNFDPVDILLRGTTDDVKKATKKCVSAGNETTFISAGCEVPKNTPHENLHAANKALINYS